MGRIGCSETPLGLLDPKMRRIVFPETVWDYWTLKMGRIGCAETPVTTDVCCMTSQKSEDVIYTAAEAWNLECS
jgi:hypothetical protein